MKQAQEESLQFHFLMQWTNLESIKGILAENAIIVLWLKESELDPKQFGNIFAKIATENIDQIIVKTETLEVAINLLMKAWFVIEDVNFFQNPINSDEVQKLLHNILQEVIDQKKEEKLEIQQKATARTKTYANSGMDKLQPIFNELFAYIDEIQLKTKEIADYKQAKELQSLAARLRKRRMWRNLDKIREILNELFQILDDIYEKYIAYLQKSMEQKDIFPDTINKELDVVREYHLLQKSKTIKALGINQSSDDKYYGFSQEFGIYQRFLQKDLSKKFSKTTNIFYHLFTIVEFSVIVIALIVWSYVLSQERLYNQVDITQIYSILWKLGILWLLIFVARYLRKQNIWRLFLLSIGIVAFLFILSYIVSLLLAL